MNSNELFIEAAELKDRIRQAIYHPYLLKYIEPPKIDEEKLLILCSISNEKNDNIKQETILSTMLVQIALDIHDNVLLIDLTSNSQKERQLTVLAGDYYSSLYYKRLSLINERRLIRMLADGIKEVNELKTLFLYGENLDTKQLLHIQWRIEGCILNQFSLAVRRQKISPIINEFFLLKRLMKEKELIDNGLFSLWIHLFGRQFTSNRSNKKNVELLPQEIYKKAVQTVDSLIIKSCKKIEAMLKNDEDDIVSSIVKRQLSLFKASNSLFE
ncbi:heptaprenyl diphosphate synthase [Pueribacillus theae]|uniref:Heptaprenyl diphosphate synthase n=1 Tax=Pueribacillus theae TaxID=2171751 RepID=A0A2U1K4F3_9BACI|nr:heptaprenyl diphosphate synthase component 1 [Pueribacillus theae]PWA12376.1 heptaprenyl diphosphate synthase [Pueribacillus theae]